MNQINTTFSKNIHIVLVNPTHPGNIGATARAMKTMCLQNLSLVSPKHYPSADATARACGADDILMQANVCENLSEALTDCHLVIGASARLRSLQWPQLNPRECATKVLNASAQGPVAILFGREHSGLKNEELAMCHYLLHIPTNPAYQSLNLAAAVQLIGYEIYINTLTNSVIPSSGISANTEKPATTQEMDGFYEHLQHVLTDTGYLNPAQPRQLLQRLRRFYNRAKPDHTELNILRGILTAIQKQLKKTKQ